LASARIVLIMDPIISACVEPFLKIRDKSNYKPCSPNTVSRNKKGKCKNSFFIRHVELFGQLGDDTGSYEIKVSMKRFCSK